MNDRRPRLCFIDDDERFEIPLFLRTFGEEFDLIAAAGLEACLRQIGSRGDWTPDLFVLDMYFPSGAPDAQAVEALAAQPLPLPPDRAEIRPAYQNHLLARKRLEAVLAAWRQGPDGGLQLAAEVHARFPDVPIVFYSRKATAGDVLRCLEQDGVLDVLTKPTGRDDADTQALTQARRGALAARFRECMDAAQARAGAAVRDAARLLLREVSFLSGR